MQLGLDLGTSGLKAVLVDDNQKIRVSTTAALDVSRPAHGWSEQHPDCWVAACREALAELVQKDRAAMAAVRGIGLSGQMHGATLIDRDDRALRPALLWNDTRAYAEAAALDALPAMRKITGNIVFPGFTAPKLRWIATHEPDIFARIAKVLLPKDYLRLWLTGQTVSDMSDASGTSWLHVEKRAWSDHALSATGLSREHMPELVEGSRCSGHLRKAVADEFAMPAGVPVAGGAGDNAAAAIGVGVIEEGDAFLSLGTSGVLFVANGDFRPNPANAVHTFCHALPDRWHQMGVVLSAADSLSWLAGVLRTPANVLTDELGSELAPPGQVRFLPYLGGERTPHNDAIVRAGLVGLSHSDDRTALVQAVLEGVAFAFRDCHTALTAAGTTINRCLAVGGGTRSEYWLKLMATVLNLPVDVPAMGDFGGAFGAARLAVMAGGARPESEICTLPPIARTVKPDEGVSDALERAYEDYRSLYPSLHALAARA